MNIKLDYKKGIKVWYAGQSRNKETYSYEEETNGPVTYTSGYPVVHRIIEKSIVEERTTSTSLYHHTHPELEERIYMMNLRMTSIEEKLDKMKSLLEYRGINIQNESKVKLQNDICQRLGGLLEQDYKDEYVAITYDGRIVASAESEIDLLKDIDEKRLPKDQIFIHKVGTEL